MTNKEIRKGLCELFDKAEENGVKGYGTTVLSALNIIAIDERYQWHDLDKDEDDLPEQGKTVLVYIVGSDVIICKDGETVEEAIERICKTHRRTSVGVYCGDGEWVGADGYPMVVTPTAWKYIEPFERSEER